MKSNDADAKGPKGKPRHAGPKADSRKEEESRKKQAEEKASSFAEWVDPVTLSEEPDEPGLDLLGERGYLRRGGGKFIVGATEVGKSSLATQLSIEWACNHPESIIKTANNQTLRVLVIQSEDDRQDSREMARCIKFLKLTPEQRALVKKNVHFTQWRGVSETRVIKGQNGDEDTTEEISAIERLLEIVEDAIKKFGPVDIIIVNPLSAYAEDGVQSQKANQRLLYGKVSPFLTKHNCGIIFIHHPTKQREGGKEKSIYSLLYSQAGDATLSNWPRASLFIWPKDKETNLFEFEPGKRANRLGWGGSRFYKWSTEGIFWQRASFDDVKRSDDSAKGKSKVQLISAVALLEVFNGSEKEWILHGDLIHILIKDGYTEATARRTIHQVDGYQRDNIEYRGKAKKLELRWKGFNPNPNPVWRQK